MQNYILRPIQPDDTETLWLALTWAASMKGDREEAVEKAKADDFLKTYVERWGRKGDDGVIAEDADGNPVGAVWIRLAGRKPHHHLKVSTTTVPELSIAVWPEHGGQGLGMKLMREQIGRARGKHKAIALSVRQSNPAFGLYMRLGFRAVSREFNRAGTLSWVMRLKL